MTKVSLFLFAHQDDEFALFEEIYTSIQDGKIVYCAFLTRGVKNGYNSKIRNEESIRVLSFLGVNIDNIFFVGDILSVHDGELINSLLKAYKWIYNFLSKQNKEISIYIPAWEGGHPDHDCLHGISIKAIEKVGALEKSYQYPLYNRLNCIGPFFRVLYPIPSNGEIQIKKIPFFRRIRFLSYLAVYKSQRKTWLGLFPATFIHYTFKKSQILQKVTALHELRRPHSGTLYYEYRKFSTWDLISSKLKNFIEKNK